jgi:uncharacterized protein YqgQ
MTIEVNFRVVWKKDLRQKGTVKQIMQSGKIKTYIVIWDEPYFFSGFSTERIFKSHELMELYKSNLLSKNEKDLSLLQRNATVEKNQKQKWEIEKIESALISENNTEVPVFQKTTKSISIVSDLKCDLQPIESVGKFVVQNHILIEPAYNCNKFCKFDKKLRVSATLSRFYHDTDSEESGADDDEEIHDPMFPYITKREMRFYIFNFTFKELYQNNLIRRLNEDNQQRKSSNDYKVLQRKDVEIDLMKRLLKMSLSSDEENEN